VLIAGGDQAGEKGQQAVDIDNRLTAAQLAALAPGDPVSIEITSGVGRPKHVAGTVARVAGPYVVVKVTSRHGGTYAEHYRLRDGVRVGGLGHAELIQAHRAQPAPDDTRRRTAKIDAAYRDWTRDRGDVDRLRRLHAAIEEFLPDGASVR
jgi:hypothetical protein